MLQHNFFFYLTLSKKNLFKTSFALINFLKPLEGSLSLTLRTAGQIKTTQQYIKRFVLIDTVTKQQVCQPSRLKNVFNNELRRASYSHLLSILDTTAETHRAELCMEPREGLVLLWKKSTNEASVDGCSSGSENKHS